MSTSLYYHTQGIRGYQFHNHEYCKKKLIAVISKNPKKIQCSNCKSFNVTATYIKNRLIKGQRVGKKFLYFKLKMHRLRCHNCAVYLMEKVQFTSSAKSRITRSLERTIMELRPHMCISALAKYLGLRWNAVKDVEKARLQKKYKRITLKDVKIIGIDEVHMGKEGYLTIVRDLETGAVLFVAKGKKGETLDDFARRIKHAQAKIEVVAVDLAPSFTSWISKKFPDATIVYDHFHVIKLMNDKLNSVRRRTMNKLEEEDKKELKNMRWLFLKNIENLDNQDTEKIDKCKAIFTELGTTHGLKESLRFIYKNARDVYDAELAFITWCRKAQKSNIPELITMAKTITNHIEGILAYWTTGKVTSASMEGFNNKIGWLTRQAYGYRDQKYLILKIFDLPNIDTEKRL